ncbi:heavy-metal-associated domain-containing protein [Dactylosporangium sp. NPDC000555]|uniref:heavy-metal-associated domain-containing protein n=1 Tax=Dactylosporangium sp. NPDC000555 TaxID=3154260 RepID=UPI003323D9ED
MNSTPTTATMTFQVEGMHCGSCGLLIDDTLEDLPGVSASTTSVRTGRTTITLDPARVTPEQVITAIGELGDYAARREQP